MNQTIELLMSHRSVRKFEDRKIEEEVIETIIKSAQWSATSSHFQAYTIIQVEDPGKRRAIAELAGGQKHIVQCPLFLIYCADLKRSKKYWDNIETGVLGNTEMLIMATVDAALAAQKAFIAAQSLGLGGVYIGGIRNDLIKTSTILDLPELVYPIFGMCLGYPAENNAQKPRLPKEVIHKVDSYSEEGDDSLIADYNDVMRRYYSERTGGKKEFSWSEHCGSNMMAKPRQYIGGFLKGKGFGLR